MLLRSVAEHARTQNWTEIGIDLLIVIVGVFLGIQVSNWNESRVQAQRAQGYLERLRDDLLVDARNLEAKINFDRDVMRYGEEALAFEDRNAPSAKPNDGSWEDVLAFFQASQVDPYYPVDATYDELQSAGELALIKNQDLRVALAEYYFTSTGTQSDYILRLIPHYRETVRGLTPWAVTKYIWASCHEDGSVGDNQRLLPCDSPISDEQAQTILAAYLADPDLLPQLRFWMSSLSAGIALMAINHQAALRLVGLIEADMN